MLAKIFKWTGNLFIVFILSLSALLFYSAFDGQHQPGQVPSVFGYKMMNVLSGSMKPTLSPGDMIIAKETDPETVNVEDVILYTTDEHEFVTHRVVNIELNGGELFFTTKGDANNAPDQTLVSADQLIGSLVLNIPMAGYAADFLISPYGIIVLISILSLIWVVGRIIKPQHPKDRAAA